MTAFADNEPKGQPTEVTSSILALNGAFQVQGQSPLPANLNYSIMQETNLLPAKYTAQLKRANLRVYKFIASSFSIVHKANIMHRIKCKYHKDKKIGHWSQ